jgi:hypothetical protein
MIAAVLDELRIDALSSSMDVQFRILAELLAKMREDDIAVSKHSDLWYAQAGRGLFLTDLLFVPDYIDEDVRQQLIREIDRLPIWNVDGELRTSRQYVIDQVAQANAAACIVLSIYSNVLETPEGKLYLVGTASEAVTFYQAAIEIGRFSEKSLIHYAALAFPNLYFHSDLERQIANFSTKYQDGLRSMLVEALIALNDQLFSLLIAHTDLREVAKQFRGITAFEISPESPNTHRNANAMRERDVVFGTERIRCEWHLKLRPDRDRIHFYFGRTKVAPGKILIGIFCRHLPT